MVYLAPNPLPVPILLGLCGVLAGRYYFVVPPTGLDSLSPISTTLQSLTCWNTAARDFGSWLMSPLSGNSHKSSVQLASITGRDSRLSAASWRMESDRGATRMAS